MRPSNRVEKLFLFLLTLLAFALRVYRLDAQSYWIDEAWSVYFANLSIGQLWHLLGTVEPLPPFYHPTTIYWVKLVGDAEFAFRFYSLLFGVLAVPFTYRLGKALGDSRLGVVAALLMTVAPYQIWHSQEARMYSILTATAAMSMWGFVNLWRRGGWQWWLIYVMGTVWAIMTHYHGAVLFGIQGLFVLLTFRYRRRQGRFLAWSGALGAILLLQVPWLLFGGNLLRSYLNWIEQPTLWETYLRSAVAYSVGELVPRPQAIPLTLVFVGFFFLGLLYVARRSWGVWRGPEMLALLLAFTLAPNFAAWAYGEFRTTVYFERYLIPVQVGYLLGVSAGVLAVADGLRRFSARGATSLAGLSLALLMGISAWVLGHHYFDPTYAKPDWRAVARAVQSFELPGDAIVITGDGGEKAFNYYYRGDADIYLEFNTPVPSEDQARRIIADIAGSHPRLWYTPYGVDIDHVLEGWLSHNGYPAWQSWLGRKRLALYGGSHPAAQRLETLNASLGNLQGQTLSLRSVTLPAGPVAAGDVIPLTLTWIAETELGEDYALSLRLVNDQGDVFAQSDWPPLSASGGTASWNPHQPVIDRRGLWLSPDIPPGDFLLQFVVYSPVSGRPLSQPVAVSGVDVGPANLVVTPEALAIPNPIKKALNGLNLVGYSLPESIKPGEAMWLWLYWQAEKLPGPDTRLRLSLFSEGETNWADFALSDSVGPLTSWQPGQVRRAVYHLPTSPRLQGEQAQVGLALLSGSGLTEGQLTLADIKLSGRPHQFEAPPIVHSTDLLFEDPPVLKLIGYEIPASDYVQREPLSVTLFWRAEAEMETNYTVFVQLLNADWQVVAQSDLQPLAGGAPTSTWLPGEILRDQHVLALPNSLPSGDYRVIAGMYDPATGRRLPVSNAGDFVDLGMVTIR